MCTRGRSIPARRPAALPRPRTDDTGLAPPAGWLPTDPHTLEVKGHERIYALGDATDLPLSKAGSTAHFEAPVVTERIFAAVERRAPDAKLGSYTGKVMCFFEVGDGKGTLLQFDYDHPPQPPAARRRWGSRGSGRRRSAARSRRRPRTPRSAPTGG